MLWELLFWMLLTMLVNRAEDINEGKRHSAWIYETKTDTLHYEVDTTKTKPLKKINVRNRSNH
jgi:hypothetical protein